MVHRRQKANIIATKIRPATKLYNLDMN